MPHERPEDILKVTNLVLDRTRQEVTACGQTHHLTPLECRLLATFMQHPGETLSREFLMREVWETDFAEDTRTLEVHVSGLRKKIEEGTSDPQYILTVRGIGYMFVRD